MRKKHMNIQKNSKLQNDFFLANILWIELETSNFY